MIVARLAVRLGQRRRSARRSPGRPRAFCGSVAGTLPLPSTEMPSVSQTIAMVLAVNCPPQAPAPGQATIFEQLEVAVDHPAGRVRADRFEHVLNRHLAAVELPRRNRAAVEHHAGHVQPRQRHDPAGNRLVAADQHDQAVEAVAARDELDRVGDHLAADERGAHALGAHRDAVGDRHRVELHRRAAGGADARLDVLGQRPQVQVARADFDPGVGDADERLLADRRR